MTVQVPGILFYSYNPHYYLPDSWSYSWYTPKTMATTCKFPLEYSHEAKLSVSLFQRHREATDRACSLFSPTSTSTTVLNRGISSWRMRSWKQTQTKHDYRSTLACGRRGKGEQAILQSVFSWCFFFWKSECRRQWTLKLKIKHWPSSDALCMYLFMSRSIKVLQYFSNKWTSHAWLVGHHQFYQCRYKQM